MDVVNVDVSVTDGRGKFLRDLKRENFRVLDDGVEQPITNFAAIDAPAQVLVLVETSPAVYLIHRQHLDAAFALLNGLAAEDAVALATYDAGPRVVLPFSQDKRSLYLALQQLRYNLGSAELKFYESVSTGLDWLGPLPGKKAMVLLTTGLDSSSANRWEVLAEKLRASEIVVFPVALGGDLRDFRPKQGTAASEIPLSFAEANRTLEEMARLTGGRAYFPKEARAFAGIYAELAAQLRHLYSLGFAPRARDGRYHAIEVQLLDAQGRALGPAAGKAAHRVYARQGYLAPKSE